MDSVIEVQRQTHEDIERIQRALSTVLSSSSSSQQSKLSQEYKASQLLDRLVGRVATLKNAYDDEETRKAEIDALSAAGQLDDLSGFYTRLDTIQQYHLKYPETVVGGLQLELATLLEDEQEEETGEEEERDDPLALLFSGEEAYGRYVDLYIHHTSYNNLSHIDKRLGYLQYLDVLIATKDGLLHRELSKDARRTGQYESYISALHAYLLSFIKRTQPLSDIDTQQQEAVLEFDRLWLEQQVTGWEDQPKVQAHDAENIHLWCDACHKQYSKQTVYDAHLKSKKHIKLASRTANGSISQAKVPGTNGHSMDKDSSVKAKFRLAALLTYLSTTLLASMEPILQETKSNVERRFSLTAREREAELTENPVAPPSKPSAEEGGEEEEEEERIYNPLKLPLGWDGKPIPYWLYKLHGLGVEYRCEICSDHVYMGRKNFDRHFQESRHAFGMRALGLPNTKHFHEITRIEDALSLAEKLKQEGKHEIFQQETMEELEDDEGNVYNRKTYEDLKKQGLI